MGYSPFRPTGVTHHEPGRAFAGYTVYATNWGAAAYAVDMEGRVVHTWPAPNGWRTLYAHLLPTGNLLMRCMTDAQPWRLGGASAELLELDWDGKVVWRYSNPGLHHDHCRLPNGNTLLLLWEPLPKPVSRRVKGGVPGSELEGGVMLGDTLLEVDAAGREVWRFPLRQALDFALDRICPLEARHEWTHANAVSVVPGGRILLSFRYTDTIALLDRTTGTFTWRYGPGVLSHQHDPSWLPNGHILVFNNGEHRLKAIPHSSVMEIDPATNAVVWEYKGSPEISFSSPTISGAQRLPNGNTLITEGRPGRLFEVTPDKDIVWEYNNPHVFDTRTEKNGALIFRARRYAADGPELRGRLP